MNQPINNHCDRCGATLTKDNESGYAHVCRTCLEQLQFDEQRREQDAIEADQAYQEWRAEDWGNR